MPRRPQVTRTIKVTKANILCLDTETCETFPKEITLPGRYRDNKSMLKQAENQLASDKIKVVHIIDTAIVPTLYGMTEADFIQHAKILPPRNTKNTND